jgi:CRP/FNR family transcriptional regulator
VLDESDLELLNTAKVCQIYPAGQIIYHQGAPSRGIYCIESGTVAIRKTDAQGNSIMVRLAHSGQTLGYRDYFGGQGYTASAETLVPCTVCHIDSALVRKMLERNPSLGLQFLIHIAVDLENAEESILQQASLSVRTRLAHLLLTLKEHYAGVNDNGIIVMSLPMTRQDMAALLGTRPETIARTIHAMENDSVVSFSGRTVMIPNLDTLLDEIEA